MQKQTKEDFVGKKCVWVQAIYFFFLEITLLIQANVRKLTMVYLTGTREMWHAKSWDTFFSAVDNCWVDVLPIKSHRQNTGSWPAQALSHDMWLTLLYNLVTSSQKDTGVEALHFEEWYVFQPKKIVLTFLGSLGDRIPNFYLLTYHNEVVLTLWTAECRDFLGVSLGCHMADLAPVSASQPQIHFPQFVKWLIIKVHKRIDTREGDSHTSIRTPMRPVQVSLVKHSTN